MIPAPPAADRQAALTKAAIGAALVLAILASACKEDDEEVEVYDAAPPIDPMQEVEAAIEAIHEGLPDELAPHIRFEAVALEDGDLIGAVPAGWEAGAIPWNLRPPSGEDAELDLGFHTEYGLGFACAGRCEPKDWANALADQEFAQFTASDSFEVIRDERVHRNGRLIVAQRGAAIYLVVAWWREGASRYAFCRATLDGPAAGATEAFESACRAAHFEL